MKSIPIILVQYQNQSQRICFWIWINIWSTLDHAELKAALSASVCVTTVLLMYSEPWWWWWWWWWWWCWSFGWITSLGRPNALCSYPYVKVSNRDLSQIFITAPIFKPSHYFRQNIWVDFWVQFHFQYIFQDDLP